MKKAMMALVIVVAGMAMSAPVKSNVAGETIIRNGENLPYDAEVEYLESTGTQWIDTGAKIEKNDRMDCTFSLLEYGNATLSGARKSTSYDCSAIWAYTLNERGIRFDYYAFDGDRVNPRITSIAPTLGQDYVVSKLGERNFVDGAEVTSNSAASNYAPTYSCYLFAMNNGGTASYIGKVRIKRFGISGKCDFIPVRFTNELGQTEGAMYDRANPTVGMNPDGSPRTDGLYCNRGTGSFIIGPDKR